MSGQDRLLGVLAALVVALAAVVVLRSDADRSPPGALPPRGTAEALLAAVCAEEPVACPPSAPADSCVDCHVGSATSRSPEHARHRTATCTDCHRGDGRFDDAHRAHGTPRDGRVEPLLAGIWTQASCIGCHQPWGPPSGADVWRFGDRLWTDWGCGGCHAGSENRLGPNLAEVAGWWGLSRRAPEVPLPWSDAPPLAQFLGEAIRVPASHLPPDLPRTSAPAVMPPFTGNDDELTALVVKVMSLRDWRQPTDAQGPSVAPVAVTGDGAALYADPERGCAACHAIRGEGGALGPPLDGWIGGDAEALGALLVDPLRVPLAGYPPVHPTDLAEVLSDEERAALVRWITSP